METLARTADPRDFTVNAQGERKPQQQSLDLRQLHQQISKILHAGNDAEQASQNVATVAAATEELTQLFYKMSEKLYQQQAPQGEQAGPDAGAAGQGGQGAQGGEYYDADYKVVDDDENKNK